MEKKNIIHSMRNFQNETHTHAIRKVSSGCDYKRNSVLIAKQNKAKQNEMNCLIYLRGLTIFFRSGRTQLITIDNDHCENRKNTNIITKTMRTMLRNTQEIERYSLSQKTKSNFLMNETQSRVGS